MSATVWTSSRKWMGNLIPALFWLVPSAVGIAYILKDHDLTGRGLIWLVAGNFVGWLALNQFGLFQNAGMKRRLLALLGPRNDLPATRFFVGFATPKFAGALDAHEDIGYLCETDQDIVFVSETRTAAFKKSEVQKIVFRPNVHSMVFLGRWISIEGVRNGLPIRMLVEPRERNTMLGNLLYSKTLMRHLKKAAGVDKQPASP